ncbi:hypothetical protein F5877DRAFT_54629 [Lentinula edodes]|nr:hypothetical protein F5877DRAFT_54629 [Lentinula edodes]
MGQIYGTCRRCNRGPANSGDRGATTALAWITRSNDSDTGLAFGTENGYLCVWKQSENEEWTETYCKRLTGSAEAQEIVGMAYDIGSTQLAVVHRSEVVHRFLVNSSMHPNPLGSKSISKHWPQAVGFGQTGARGPEIWSFGREDGVINVLNENGTIIQSWPTATVIGHAAINVKEDVMIIDDVAQGVALYKLSTSERVRTFPVPSSERRSRNVAFHDGGSAIVCGSDHGIVYIFDRKTGDTLDAIDMGIEDWVQSVVVRQDHAARIILSQTL